MKPQKDLEKNKQCFRCFEQINSSAKVCKHCNSTQNWKRHLHFSNIILSLVVALVAILSYAIPKMIELKISNQSDIKAEFTFSDKGKAYILVSNNGKRPALIKSFCILLDNYELDFDFNRIDLKGNKSIVSPSSTSIYTLEQSLIKENQLIESFETGEEEESNAEYIYRWLEFFPGLTKIDNSEVDWIKIGLINIQHNFEKLDFETLNDMTFDWGVENNYTRVKEFQNPINLQSYQNEDEYDDILETIDVFNNIDSTSIIIESYFRDKTSLRVTLYNSDGTLQIISIPLEYAKIREFIFRFYYSNSTTKIDGLTYFYH